MKLFFAPLTLFPLLSFQISLLTDPHKETDDSSTSRDTLYQRIHDNFSYLSKLIVAFALWLLLSILHTQTHTH